jgi:hypothetical protein
VYLVRNMIFTSHFIANGRNIKMIHHHLILYVLYYISYFIIHEEGFFTNASFKRWRN